jgi:Na+/proline symporter
VQLYAGSHLLSAATGLSAFTLMPTILIVTLAYGIVSGLQASIVTDFIQMLLILFPGWILVSLVLVASGGHLNLHGVTSSGGLNPFDPKIMFTVGVISSIGLISGSICDQQFWQRCLAIKETDLKKSFLFAALLFSSVPISLSLLGFSAAAPEVGLKLPVDYDVSLVGFAIVQHLLPAGVAVLYLYMLLAGLCSTLDSALSAASSLDALLQKKPWENGPAKKEVSIHRARRSMVIISSIGLALAYGVECIPGFGLKYFWWFFNSIAACMAVPTVLSLFWNKLTARGILIGTGFGIFVGLPLVVYSSLTTNDWLLSGSYLSIVFVSVLSCWLTGKAQEVKVII